MKATQLIYDNIISLKLVTKIVFENCKFAISIYIFYFAIYWDNFFFILSPKCQAVN